MHLISKACWILVVVGAPGNASEAFEGSHQAPLVTLSAFVRSQTGGGCVGCPVLVFKLIGHPPSRAFNRHNPPHQGWTSRKPWRRAKAFPSLKRKRCLFWQGGRSSGRRSSASRRSPTWCRSTGAAEPLRRVVAAAVRAGEIVDGKELLKELRRISHTWNRGIEICNGME